MRLPRIDVFECQRVFRHVRRIGITANSEVVILLISHADQITRIGPCCIHTIDVVSRFAEQRYRIKIRPPFPHSRRLHSADPHASTHSPSAHPPSPHPRRLQSADPHASTHSPIAQPMCVFVQHHFCIQVPVSARTRPVENVHLHSSR